jgi:ABC-type multidrug transport system fused ATPase/permease subunit
MIKRSVPIDGAVEKGLTPSHPGGDLGLRKINHIFATTPNISVVQDLSISFPHKKTAAVAGSSGSRKRSIVKLLMRFYEPGQSQNLLGALKLKSST